MNKKYLIPITVILIGALVVSGGSFPFTISETQTKTGLFVFPLFGYYECKQEPQTYDRFTITDSNSFTMDEREVKCDIFSTACTMEPTYTGFNPTYRFCSSLSDTSCEATAKQMTGPVTIQSKQKIKVFNQLLSETWIKRIYTPYTLWVTSPSGGSNRVYQPNEYKCSPPLGSNLYISGDIQTTSGDQKITIDTSNKWDGLIDFGERTNFLDKWVSGPTEFNTYQNPTYGRVYATAGGAGATLYNIKTVKLQSGTYEYPGSVIGFAECLPGAISGNQMCNSNFKWESTTTVTVQCITDLQCEGQGTWVTDYNDPLRKTAVKSTCENSVCVRQTKTTACSTSQACPTGQICSLNPATGDSSCIYSGEPVLPPRVDPGTPPPPPFDWTQLLPYLIIGGFGALLCYALTRKVEWAAALGVLGVIIAWGAIQFFATLESIPIIGGFVSGLFGLLITGIIFLTIIGIVLKSAGVIK